MPRITISLENHRCRGAARDYGDHARAVMSHFGVFGRERRADQPPRRMTIDTSPGVITLLTGPSGAGKSTALRRIAARCGRGEWIRPHADAADAGESAAPRLIDTLDCDMPPAATFGMLVACGLGEPRLWLRRLDELSDGERFRAALARGVLHSLRSPSPIVLLCDEFATNLHTRLAQAVAANIRRIATRHNLTFVLATVRDDLPCALRPDAVIALQPHLPPSSARTVPEPKCGADSRPAAPTISQGNCAHYKSFAAMHYRGERMPRFVDKVFVLRDSPAGEPLGILLLCYPPLELSLRNIATANQFRHNPTLLNQQVRIIRRVIVHPDVRGCGFGTQLVRHALTHAGVRFVECLAAMGAVCPVFERAGMTRIGQCGAPRGRARLLQRMELWNIDPADPRIERRLRDCPRVHDLLRQALGDHSRAIHSAGKGHAPPTATSMVESLRKLCGAAPTYFLWDAEAVPG